MYKLKLKLEQKLVLLHNYIVHYYYKIIFFVSIEKFIERAHYVKIV